jgi:small subunit ribosomal protein S6
MNIECGQDVLSELQSGFRFNDAVLRHLIIAKDGPVTEQSFILKNKDDKGGKRRDDEGFGFGDDDDQPRRERTPRPAPVAAEPAAE